MKIDPDLVIQIDPGVYDPAEDTYLILDNLEISTGQKVLEIGCGSGIIALHCAKAGAIVTASDIDEKAVECTRSNAKRNDLEIETVQSYLFENITGNFDLIIFNPPYLPRDKINDIQWTGGEKGIESSLEFLRQCKKHLSEKGKIIIIASSRANLEEFKEEIMQMKYRLRILKTQKLFFEVLHLFELRL